MSSAMIVLLGLAVVALVIGVALARGGGPRVTQIDRTTTRERDEDDA